MAADMTATSNATTASAGDYHAVTAEWQWQDHAACVGLDTDMFFGTSNEPLSARRRREARCRMVCGSCPVQRRCLQFALSHRIRDGVWGGTSEDERNALLRRMPPRLRPALESNVGTRA